MDRIKKERKDCILNKEMSVINSSIPKIISVQMANDLFELKIQKSIYASLAF